MPGSFEIPFPFLGSITIHLYGIIIMLGALAAAWLATIEAKRRGLNAEIVWDILLWVLLGGIIGARLWHIFTPPPSMVAQGYTTQWYLTHPLTCSSTVCEGALAIWRGGLGIPGAVIGGFLALYIYSRRKGLDFRVWADVAAPAVALGQAIGRWGNYVNQELYGRPTDLPWGIQISTPNPYPPGTRFHPLFLYESIYNFFNMALLLWMGRRYRDKLLPGDIFLTYLVIYPLGRFFLDFIRLDASELAGININQTIMLIVALCSAATLAIRHVRAARAGRTETPDGEAERG